MPGLKFVPGSSLIGRMWMVGVLGIICFLASGCGPPLPASVEFTHLPPAGEGSGEILNTIEGRVTGSRPGQKIVLFARSGVWWVQPLAERPFTTIQKDSTWKNSTHPGTAYAALLVDPGYKAPLTVNVLPEKGGPVRAVAVAEGAKLVQAPVRTLNFSGYEWRIRQTPGTPAGTRNRYDPANAWVDTQGFLHLRIAGNSKGWTSAEVHLSRSLGYGSYHFVVRDISHLEPIEVLTISTGDESGPYQEMDLEISRWGELSGKNAQYVIQPYYIPANVVRFLAPPGTLTYSFNWEPGRVSFRTVRGSSARPELVSAHVFTSGVPTAGSETLGLNLYVFYDKRVPLERGSEVIVEKFEYLP